MIDLERVVTFTAVVKYGDLRETAKRTGLSQSAVAQHIKQLEQSLWTRLIGHAAMPQSLTLGGEIFFPYARQLLHTSHKATTALHDKSLVVDASSNIGIYLLQPCIRAFQDKLADKIDVRISKNIEIAALLKALKVDIAVMEWWDSRPGFVSAVWQRERMVVIVRPGHPWTAESTVPLEWLKSQNLFGGEAATGTGRLLQQYASADSAEFIVGMQLGSTEAVKHVVHAGPRISLVAESAVRREQANEWLHAIPIEEGVYRGLYLVHRSETSLSGPVASLADLILHSPDLGSVEYKQQNECLLLAGGNLSRSGAYRHPQSPPPQELPTMTDRI